MHLRAIRSTGTSPEEQALGKFTRKRLKTLPTWDQWKTAEELQLDRYEKLEMYGDPQFLPPKSILLRPHWQYHIKRDGTRRSRQCADGSPKAAPILHALADSYSACVDQPVQRMFLAISALKNYRIYGSDATDAYAHSPADFA